MPEVPKPNGVKVVTGIRLDGDKLVISEAILTFTSDAKIDLLPPVKIKLPEPPAASFSE